MSSIDLEKKRLQEWALTYTNFSFSMINNDLQSYYESVDDDDVFFEYDFASVQELKNLLSQKKKEIHDQSVDLICTVATFKCKQEIMKKNDDKKQIIIPDFIYNF